MPHPFFSHSLRGLRLSQTKAAIMQNLFWAVLGKTVNLISALLIGIFLARYLGPAKYGLMNYVISYVFLFQTIATFGLDAIEIREEAQGKTPYTSTIGTAFGLKLAFGLFFLAISVITSWLMDDDVYTTLLVGIYALSIVLNSFSVIRNYFTAIVQNKYVVQAEIARVMLGFAIKVAMLLMHASLTWFVLAYMFDFALLASGYCMAYRRKVGKMRLWKYDSSHARELLKASFPLMLTSTAVILYQRIDQVMIAQLIDDQSLGFFSVAAKFVEVLIFIPMILAQTITPVLVRIREQDKNLYEQRAQLFMNLSLWLSLSAAVVTSLVSYWLVLYTFGEAYLPAVPVLQVMAFKAASVALSNTAGAMLVTEGLQRYAVLRDSFGCIVCITLNYLLLPHYGIMAAAAVAIISNVAAGYIADAFIPAYRHLFLRQSRAILFGWKDIMRIKELAQR